MIYDMSPYQFPRPQKPRLQQAKLHVEWVNGVGMLAYVGLNKLTDAAHKVPHMMNSMGGIIALAAKRGALHNA